jgi:hypothetical protein
MTNMHLSFYASRVTGHESRVSSHGSRIINAVLNQVFNIIKTQKVIYSFSGTETGAGNFVKLVCTSNQPTQVPKIVTQTKGTKMKINSDVLSKIAIGISVVALAVSIWRVGKQRQKFGFGHPRPEMMDNGRPGEFRKGPGNRQDERGGRPGFDGERGPRPTGQKPADDK